MLAQKVGRIARSLELCGKPNYSRTVKPQNLVAFESPIVAFRLLARGLARFEMDSIAVDTGEHAKPQATPYLLTSIVPKSFSHSNSPSMS